MQLVDTHAHLYLDDFDSDRDACIQRARDAGVEQIFLPNIDEDSIEPMLQLEGEYPGYCHAMMGLHPCSVKDDWEKQLEVIERHMEKQTFCALGEIGMDLYWDTRFKQAQEKALRRQIGWAKDMGIPVVIHNREATPELLQIVRDEQDGNLGGIFHCFTGSVEEGKQMIDLNFYLGIGGILTFKNSSLDEVIRELPLDRLVLETDAPYLAPHPKRGERNESAYLQYVLTSLAEAKDLDAEEVAEVTSWNAAQVYGTTGERDT